MSKFSFVHFILLVLIFSVYAQKRCRELLYPSNCTLLDCGEKCFNKHHDQGHTCIANPAGTDYACYCIYNC
ncbi:putative defensin-like protein 165 [Pyrus x bretschneideri]|uniref:putative defensin-like protein 165 n=1 Tax=Pyrus x bretschneideri TaxID=225117 RepID=UPI00202FCA11|nr:putative defensin-like protein 165 [Pyrus x bretschneideri]